MLVCTWRHGGHLGMKNCFHVNSSKNCLLYCHQHGRPDTCLQTKNRKFQEPWSVKACLHESGVPQVSEVTCGGLPHLTCKRDHIKTRDCMDRRVTPPKRVTSPTWGPPPLCKQALIRHKGRNTLGDELQQHVAETDHSLCAGRAGSCTNKLRRRIAGTSGFVCTGDFLVKNFLSNRILSLHQVAQILSDLIFLRHVAATKIFAKIVQYTRVTAACYCKLLPCVFRPKLAFKMTIDLDKSTSSHSLCS